MTQVRSQFHDFMLDLRPSLGLKPRLRLRTYARQGHMTRLGLKFRLGTKFSRKGSNVKAYLRYMEGYKPMTRLRPSFRFSLGLRPCLGPRHGLRLAHIHVSG